MSQIFKARVELYKIFEKIAKVHFAVDLSPQQKIITEKFAGKDESVVNTIVVSGPPSLLELMADLVSC